MRRLLVIIMALGLIGSVAFAQAEDSRSDSGADVSDSLSLVHDFLTRGLIRGVYVGGHVRQVEERFQLKAFVLTAGYIVEMGNDFLGALDLSLDTENGIAGVGPMVMVPARERIWIVAGAEIVNLAITTDGGIENNRTASIKGGFVALVKDKPIWGNAYLAISAFYVSRTVAAAGSYLETETVQVEKPASIENGLWLGLDLFFN